jgi:hypothetical protein
LKRWPRSPPSHRYLNPRSCGKQNEEKEEEEEDFGSSSLSGPFSSSLGLSCGRIKRHFISNAIYSFFIIETHNPLFSLSLFLTKEKQSERRRRR